MTDEANKPTDGTAKRRRRRRRRPQGGGEASPDKPRASDKPRARDKQRAADKPRARDKQRAADKPSVTGPSEAASSGRPRRRRRRRPGAASRGDAPKAAADNHRSTKSGGRRRRRRGAERPAHGKAEPSQASAAPDDTPRAPVDDWARPSSEADEPLDREHEPRYVGGDDDSAPAPDITLARDLPDNPPHSDPDPVSYVPPEHAGSTQDWPRQAIRNVVGVKFTTAGKISVFDAGDASYQRGDDVVVETTRGPRIGVVALPSVRKPHGSIKRVLRRPDRNDRKSQERHATRQIQALQVARAHAKRAGLPIKVFRAEASQGGNRVRIYFSAESRVDFRGIVRDLSAELRARVELRQTGVRDEARMVGGIGSCGRELCCSTWLPEFVPVSIKMAKDQGLVLNPTKVSGQCGRLKCCLVYEQSMYAELRKGLPKLGKRVITDSGEGRVVEVDVLHQRVRVSLGDGQFEVLPGSEVKPMFPSVQPARKSQRSSRRKGRERTTPPNEAPPQEATSEPTVSTVQATPAPPNGDNELAPDPGDLGVDEAWGDAEQEATDEDS